MESRRVPVLAVLSTAVFACNVPMPSVADPRLTADDFKVFAAVVNDGIRKPREAELERLKQRGVKVNPPGPLLVANQTLKTCDIQDSD